MITTKTIVNGARHGVRCDPTAPAGPDDDGSNDDGLSS